MEDFSNYRSEFEICQRFVFLDHAAESPAHKRMITRVQNYLADAALGNIHENRWVENVQTVRALAAQLIKANPNEIAFVNNVTTGANIVANGIEFKDGDNIVVPTNQFPANVYPWLNLRKRGVEVRTIELPRNDSCYEVLFDAIDSNTRLLTMSFVEYNDGFRHDMKKVSEHCRRHGVLLFVDAVQGLGALQFSVEDVAVDFLTVSGHKWLLGPVGQGFIYIQQDVLDSMYILSHGWLSVVDPWDFHNYHQSFRKSADQLEGGTANLMGIAALGASLEMILEADPVKIENQVLKLTTNLADRLMNNGYTIVSNMENRFLSGILSFQHPRISSSELFQRLTATNIQVSERNECIRVSPHFYNTLEDIEALVKALPNKKTKTIV